MKALRNPILIMAFGMFLLSHVGFSQNCVIDSMVAEIVDCQNDEFFVIIDFVHDGTSDSFRIAGNGTDYGDFAYDDIPITLGPLDANQTQYEFVVVDLVEMNCSDFVEVGIVECDSSDLCNLFDLTIEFDECTSDSTYRITVDFEHDNTGGLGFDLWANDEFFDFYAYSSLPLTINNFPLGPGTVNFLTVCDNDNLNCCTEAEWPTPQCGSSADCDIRDIEIEVVDCENDEFFVIIDFIYENTSDSFRISGNGTDYGDYSYNDVPVTLGPLTQDLTQYEFVVTDLGFPNCSDFIELGIVNCDTTVVCDIFNLEVEFDECTSDSTYRVFIDFDFVNTNSDGFFFYINGEFIDFAPYDLLPLTINNFPVGQGMTNSFMVCDSDSSSCCGEIEWPTPQCGSVDECDIRDIEIEVVDCENDEFFVIIDFIYENTSDSFSIAGNGIDYGDFSYTDVPITLGPLAENQTEYEFVITDLGFPNCSDFIDLGIVDCDTIGACAIFELEVEFDECTSDSTYRITIDFEHENTGGLGFDLWANGDFFDFFSYSSLPLTINNFPLGPGMTNFLVVCDNDNPNCCADEDWSTPQCGDICEIGPLTIEEFECDSFEFYLEVDFDFVNVSDSFKIVGNGSQYGIFNYNDVPIVLGPLSVNAVYNELIVMDLGNPDCMRFTQLDVDCASNLLCGLSELDIEVGDIVTDSTFELTFTFDYQNTSDSFHAFSGNMYVGTFAYADLPITIEEFPSRDLPYELLRVCDMTFMDCCVVVEFMVGDGSDCQISDPVAEVAECAGDSVFVFVDFVVQGGSSAGFEIIGNGYHYGEFDYDDLPVLISFTYTPGDFVDLIIRDLINENCLNYTFIDEVDCDPECAISDIEIDSIICTSDTTYSFILDFEYEGTGGLGFDIWANGTHLGFYNYGSLPVTIEDFLPTGVQIDQFLVCDNDNPNCCEDFNIPTPQCISGLHNPDDRVNLEIRSTPGNLFISSTETGYIELFDMTGRVVKPSIKMDVEVKVQGLAAGVYIIKFTGHWGQFGQKAVFVSG